MCSYDLINTYSSGFELHSLLAHVHLNAELVQKFLDTLISPPDKRHKNEEDEKFKKEVNAMLECLDEDETAGKPKLPMLLTARRGSGYLQHPFHLKVKDHKFASS